MNFKKFLLATILGFVVMFLLSYLWHRVAMGDLYSQGLQGLPLRDQVLMLYPILAYAVISIVMAYLYPRIQWKGSSKAGNGLRFGTVMAVMWVVPMQLIMHAMVDAGALNVLWVDTAWHLVEQGIGGIVLAYVFTD